MSNLGTVRQGMTEEVCNKNDLIFVELLTAQEHHAHANKILEESILFTKTKINNEQNKTKIGTDIE